MVSSQGWLSWMFCHQVEFDCIHPEKQKKKSYKNSGVVSVKSCKVETALEFHADSLDIK